MNSALSGEQMPIAPDSSERWTEDLLWQAKRGAELGHALCTCEGYYHSLRGILRLADRIREDRSEEATLTAHLSPLLRDETRVLICGAADPATFCTLGRIAGANCPEITIIDKCQSPLRLIEEFAAMKGVHCETHHSDILDLDGGAKWDVVFVHYTTSFIEPGLHKRFFERLALSLTPDGTLVWVAETSQRDEGKSRKQLEEAWFDQVRNILTASPLASHWNSTERDRILHIYSAARTQRRLNVISMSEVEELLRGAGLFLLNNENVARTSVVRDRADTGTEVKSCVVISAGHLHT